jgi:hypothetical protein
MKRLVHPMFIAVGTLVFLSLAVAAEVWPLQGTPRIAPLTTLEQNIAAKCEVYFGPRPFTYFVYDTNELDRFRSDPAYLQRVKDAHVGVMAFFKTLMNGSDQKSGVRPIDGHWSWKDPVYMHEIINFLHGEGFETVAYMSPHTWEAAGLPAVDMVDEVRHLGVDGVYFDGWTIGDQPAAAFDVLTRLHNRGYVIWVHGSSSPYAKDWNAKRYQAYLPPGAEKITHYLSGEIQERPDDPDDRVRWLKSRVSLIDRGLKGVANHKPWYGDKDPPGWRAELPSLLIGVTMNRTSIAEAEADFFPKYRELALEYHQNPVPFVRALAEGW